MTRASFFDLDDTLIKGHMIFEFSKFLVGKGKFDSGMFQKEKKLAIGLAEGKVKYRKASVEIPELFSKGLKGQKKEEIKELAKEFIEGYKKEIFHFSRELVKLMNDYGLTIAVSGSPAEVVEVIQKELGLNLSFGTVSEVKDGTYTGKLERNLAVVEEKKKVLQKIVKEREIELEKSFAFGDSDQDLVLLERVGYPVVINPHSSLRKTAEDKEWPVLEKEEDVVGGVRKILGNILKQEA